MEIGQVLAHYRVVGKLGAGGMGEVYLAADSKLRRNVALKVLPPRFASDETRIARFRREAQLLASLNHPNIGAIYGLEETGDVRALVLELVEGPTLQDKLSEGPIAVNQALGIARQIAEALDAAHDRGIVHRDLKPGNIKLTADGTVKVLDFGIAKALADDSAAISGDTPTITEADTRLGMVLGTPAYMSPEQARHGRVDKRSDIWAFGCVLFEMLSGRPAFSGDTISDIQAATLRDDPPWTALPVSVPGGARRVLRRCLQKDPKQRLRDIADVQLELEEAFAAPETGEAPVPPRRRASSARWTWAAVSVALVAVAFAAWTWRSRPAVASESGAMRFVLDFDAVQVRSTQAGPYVTISPDGRRVVFAGSAGGPGQLFLRTMESLLPVAIAGTEGGVRPFFSPDGNWLAFFADRKLKKVSMSGGEPVAVADAAPEEARGGAWGDDGTILIGMPGGKFMRVRADTGATDTVTGDPADADAAYRWPEWVPGANVVLFTIARGNQFDIAAMSLDSRKREVLVKGGTQPRYSHTGHIVYAQQVSTDTNNLFSGALFAVPFDPKRLMTTGEPQPVQDGVRVRGAGAASFAISTKGALVYLPGQPFERRQLAWVDREGRAKTLGDIPRIYRSPRFSPDGQRIAVQVVDPNRGLYIYDIALGSSDRLPLEPGHDASPVWSPDGRRLAYSSDALGRSWVISLDSPKAAQPLATPAGRQRISSWSPDGTTLAFDVFDDVTGLDIWTVSVDGRAAARPWLKTPSGESQAMFSPDGRWLAYQSNEAGKAAIYIRPFPGPGNQLPVSAGTNPVWTKDGRELVFRQGMALFAVDVTTSPALAVSPPKLLLRGRFGVEFDARFDGSAFAMLDQIEEQISENQLILILDWFDELGRRMRHEKR